MNAVHRTVATAAESAQSWDSRVNFLTTGKCVPFVFEFPPTEEMSSFYLYLTCYLGTNCRTTVKGSSQNTASCRSM